MKNIQRIDVLFFLMMHTVITRPLATSEMASTSYAVQRSSVVSAGGTAASLSYLLQHELGVPNLGGMEGGQFIIGTAVALQAADGDDAPPSVFSLAQNYPNPFNQQTRFLYSLPVKSYIEISVYSVLGQHLLILFAGEQEAGRYSLEYGAMDAFSRPLPSGLYFCRMTSTKGFDKTIKFAILR